MDTPRQMDLSGHTVDTLRIAVSAYRDAERNVAAAEQELASAGIALDEAQRAIWQPDASRPICPPDEVYRQLLIDGNTLGAKAYAEYWLIRQTGINEIRIWKDRYNTCSILLKDC